MEVQEVLSNPPVWLVNWGSSLILLLIISVLALAWLVKYPDVIEGQMILTTQSPPIKVVSKSSGKLLSLHQPEGSLLQAGEVIATIENPISPGGIRYMEQVIGRVKHFLLQPARAIEFVDENLVFGNLQASYNELKKLCLDYHNWKTDAYPQQQMAILREKIGNYGKLLTLTENQLSFNRQELENAEDKYQVNRGLYEEGVISKLDFYQEETSYRQKQQGVEGVKISLTQNQITLNDLKQQLLDLEHQSRELERTYRDNIQLKLDEIENQVLNWQQSYLITAPVSGRLSYLDQLNENQFVNAGSYLFALLPENEDYVGLMDIPARGFGKVEVGQMVRIKFQNYPYQEYGQVQGRVRSIAELPDNETYRAEIALDKGLVTSYHKTLAFKPEMSGSAEIVTEDLRFLERLFQQIRALIDA
jgi:multidrug efflux pump subunit AcrA (membrane-fusion protein)